MRSKNRNIDDSPDTLVDSLWPIDAIWVSIKIGSCNGLLIHDNKPLLEPMLTYRQ